MLNGINSFFWCKYFIFKNRQMFQNNSLIGSLCYVLCVHYILCFFEDFEYLYSELWPLLVFPWCQSVYIVLHGWAARWHTSFFLRARKHFETHCILPINKSGKLGLSEVKLWAAGAYTGIKKGGCETWPRAKRAKNFFRTPRETASHPPLFAPPPHIGQ